MRGNLKGFTLIEVIVVVAIIGMLIVVAVPSALKFSKNNKEKIKQSRIKLIEDAAIQYGTDNANEVNGHCFLVSSDVSDSKCKMISLDELYKGNYITKEDLIDPTKNKKTMLSGYVEIQYYYNRFYSKYSEKILPPT